MNMNERVLLTKIETTTGVDAAPTPAANAVLCRKIEYSNKINNTERNFIRPYFGASPTVVGSDYGMLDIEIELQGAGNLTSKPAVGALLVQCGFVETFTSGTSTVYTLQTGNEATATNYYYEDEDLYKLVGCRGVWSLECKQNDFLILKLQISGLRQLETTAFAPLTADFTPWKKPLAVTRANTQFDVHGYLAALSSLSIASGNQVNYVNRPNTERIDLTGRKVTGNLAMEKPPVSAINFWDRARTATTGPMNLVHGTQPGSRVKLNAPNVQLGELSTSDENGTAMFTAPLTIVPGVSNDEFKITFD